MATKKITVREIGPGDFAVIDAAGAIVRDGFSTPKIAWMWAAKKGLHESPKKRGPRAAEIPADLLEERIYGLPLLARLSNIPYPRFLPRAHAGEFGPLIRINSRHCGLRFGGWKAAMAAREVVK